MKARAGDWLVVAGPQAGVGDRVGLITEVPHADGSPPYRVRWLGSDHEVLIYPGLDSRTAPPATQAAGA